VPSRPSKPTETPSYRVQPKVGFLSNPEQVAAYQAARNQEWFHSALTFALAQVAMSLPEFLDGQERIMAGARAFIREFYNLDAPEAPPLARFSPLQEETDD
jgi:hypothetical protein